MSRLEQMQAFVLAVKKSSIVGAAEELGVSGAAVSKQISRLEKELGVQLLIRTTRSLKMTELGSAYRDQCLRVLEEASIAEALAKQMNMVPQGGLHVVSGRYFSKAFILPYLSEFLSLYPQIEFNLELAERIPNMESEGIDLLIGMSISAPDNAIQRKIGQTRYCFCCSPAYLKLFGKPKKPQDLLKHHYISHSMRNPNNELTFKDGSRIKLQPYMLLNDAETMMRVAIDGLGIIKLHYYVVKEAIEKGELVEILGNQVENNIPLYVAYLSRRYVPNKVRSFIDFFTKRIVW
jgi:DNA-binding transcriptional LysR family regulator